MKSAGIIAPVGEDGSGAWQGIEHHRHAFVFAGQPLGQAQQDSGALLPTFMMMFRLFSRALCSQHRPKSAGIPVRLGA